MLVSDNLNNHFSLLCRTSSSYWNEANKINQSTYYVPWRYLYNITWCTYYSFLPFALRGNANLHPGIDILLILC